MGEKKSSKDQNIQTGSNSRNIQVGRDYHHHEAPKKSSIHQPTQEDIEKFDPRVRLIRDAAENLARDSIDFDHILGPKKRVGASGGLIFWLAIAALLLWILFF